MKAEIKIENCSEPYAIIYTPKINEEVQRVLSYMRQDTHTLIGQKDGRQYVLSIHEILFAQVKEEKPMSTQWIKCIEPNNDCMKSNRWLAMILYKYPNHRLFGSMLVKVWKSILAGHWSCM